LLAVLLGFVAIVAAGAWWGYFANLSNSLNESVTYDETVEYANRLESEMDQYTVDLDPMMLVPGARVIDSNAYPTQDFIKIDAQYVVRHPPYFVADQLVGQWKAQDYKISRTFDPQLGSISLKAATRQRDPRTGQTAKVVLAEVYAHNDPPGSSRVSAKVLRPPNRQESTWMAYPRELPEGPRGSKLTVKGGAMGFSRAGRMYTWDVPVDANEAMRYFKNGMLRKGWTVRPIPTDAKNGASNSGALYSYMCSMGSFGYTMSISPADASRAVVVFMPY
jgi:hypothetical protein